MNEASGLRYRAGGWEVRVQVGRRRIFKRFRGPDSPKSREAVIELLEGLLPAEHFARLTARPPAPRAGCLDGRRSPLDGPRFPLDALEEALGHPEPKALAARLGVSAQTVARWRAEGVDEYQADQLAVRCRLHPALVWGRAWWEDAENVVA